MGKGNWRPYKDADIYSLRYFDLYDIFGEEEVNREDSEVWSEFHQEIANSLPGSFYAVTRSMNVSVPYTDFAQGNSILFCNELVCIMTDADAEAGRVGVAMVLLESDENYDELTYIRNFGTRYLTRSAEPFWKRMGGTQRIRTGPWSSAEVEYK